MKRVVLLLVLWLTRASAAPAQAPDFYAHWGDGRAELSSYRIVQPRYGEPREGYGVLIFVTEDIDRKTFIKVESPAPKEERLYVLKLNNVLKFNTGIYDYSVMTSVFSQVEGGAHPFELRKLSLSAQEWCGHVFDEVQARNGRLEGHISSYFESEGRHPYELDYGRSFESEDHLLIRIRELGGPFLAPGEEREMEILPTLWSFRLRHRPHALVQGKVRKGETEGIALGGESLLAVRWDLEMGERRRTLWVESAYPHRILKWEDGDGGRGELVKTIRVPYWKLHGNADEVYREELQIP
jgi:hypothetical protein